MNQKHICLALVALTSSATLSGCEAALLLGGMRQNYEYSKQIEVEPVYYGLENKTVAVIVQADQGTLYEHPGLELTLATGISARIQKHVAGVRVVDPSAINSWKFKTREWYSMPYGEIAEKLNVDRLVFVDVYEYRLNPIGNRYLWDGVCAANVGIIERDGFDPDTFVDSFSVENRYPPISGVGRESAPRSKIEEGVMGPFVMKTAGLFHTHLVPKHPDKYKALPK